MPGLTNADVVELAVDEAMAELRIDLLGRDDDGPEGFALNVVCAYLRAAYARGYYHGLTEEHQTDPVVVLRVARQLLARASLLGNQAKRRPA